MARLRVGQACVVLMLPGFGVSSSSPQVPEHPTSICDAGINVCLTTFQLKNMLRLKTGTV